MAVKRAAAGAALSVSAEDLAAASRILAAHGVFDSAGHVSMRHPDRADHFLMSRSLAPALVTAGDIMEFTLDSEPCDPSTLLGAGPSTSLGASASTSRGAGDRKPFLERFLHGEIYRKRADVMAIAHGHAASLVPFGLVEHPLRAMYHNAAFLAAGVPVFDIRDRFGETDIVVSTAERGAALADALDDKSVALLRAHGFVAVGPSLQVAVFRAIYAEVNARVQLHAESLGGLVAALSEEEGQKADLLNVGSANRSWELWKSHV
jgi:HCOMODA/2-hydroxy-3-carboxy-muconic semialdehyde decarboxylase